MTQIDGQLSENALLKDKQSIIIVLKVRPEYPCNLCALTLIVCEKVWCHGGDPSSEERRKKAGGKTSEENPLFTSGD